MTKRIQRNIITIIVRYRRNGHADNACAYALTQFDQCDPEKQQQKYQHQRETTKKSHLIAEAHTYTRACARATNEQKKNIEEKNLVYSQVLTFSNIICI